MKAYKELRMKHYTISIVMILTFFLTKADMDVIAIIPSAGFGTRFLPFTKIVPKELVPLNGIPAIEYIFIECITNNIKRVCIVTSPYKQSLIDYCQHNELLDAFLQKQNKENLLNSHYHNLESLIFEFAYQEEAKGLGHAILCAKNQARNCLAAVLLPDDIMTNQSAIGHMVEYARQNNASVIAVQKVPVEKVSHYGIVALASNFDNQIASITAIVEKPLPEQAPSQYAVIGRYVLQPEIFAMLEQIRPGKNGELQLTDAIALLIEKGHSVVAYEYEGIRFDVGNPKGFNKANDYYTK
jgi:UTP--glucose-1-phosphate uridylyltransferase